MKSSFVLGLAVLAAVASSASGQGFRFTEPGPGVALRVGQQVAVRWSGLTKRAEEMELLLSLDDGRTFRVRLTQQMDVSSDAFLWEVPALPGHSARLAMRANVAGHELVIGESARFEIQSSADSRVAAPRPAIVERAGELWAEESAVVPRTPGSRGMRPPPPPPRFSDGGPEAAATEPRAGAALARRAGPTASKHAVVSRVIEAGAAVTSDRRPLAPPLRN